MPGEQGSVSAKARDVSFYEASRAFHALYRAERFAFAIHWKKWERYNFSHEICIL